MTFAEYSRTPASCAKFVNRVPVRTYVYVYRHISIYTRSRPKLSPAPSESVGPRTRRDYSIAGSLAVARARHNARRVSAGTFANSPPECEIRRSAGRSRTAELTNCGRDMLAVAVKASVSLPLYPLVGDSSVAAAAAASLFYGRFEQGLKVLTENQAPTEY